ncbi:unannotated protein [freshwater metagenome]|uniref:Unannotated protein n=1 Tax=freshwater metagenome TaxID=449393 RepID=A0A6J7S676_9ZZZZ
MPADVIADKAGLTRRGSHVTGVGLDYGRVLWVVSRDHALRLLFDLVLCLGLRLLLSLRLLFSLSLWLLCDFHFSLVGGRFGGSLSLWSIGVGL